MMSGLDTGNSVAAFERMEEKVEEMEAYAEVTGELAGTTSMDQQFKALEGSMAVDDDLAALKKQISGGSDKKALPSAEDEEIRKMREQLKGK